MKHLFFQFIFLFAIASLSHASEIVSGQVYKISTFYNKNRTLTVENSSLDDNARVFLWTETGVNSQRWRVTDAGDGKFYIENAYTRKKLQARTTSEIVQFSSGTSEQFKWSFSEIEEAGYEQCFFIKNAGNSYCLEIGNTNTDSDGSVLRLVSDNTLEPRRIWKIELADDIPNIVMPDMRETMMQSWKDMYFAGEVASPGFWGTAENMEILLDAYETTGKEEYKTMFENLYSSFVNRHGRNWARNEYNDDIAWAVLASIRAYFMFGNNSGNDYLNIAKTNFDLMYNRALYLVDGLYYLLRWKEGLEGANSCVNGPAEIAACYLAQATGDEAYYEKAKMLYANQRVHMYEPATGHVYDTFSNSWASTYNQGTYLGAAVMLYNHYGDEMYKKDAEMIMDFTRKHLCNKHGIVNVCGGEGNDLPGFKGILMRYARRFVVDLGNTEYAEWMQKNAIHAYNNRNSDGITWTAWWNKAEEKRYNDAFGAFTAVSAAMNAPMNKNVNSKDAFSTIEAGSFDYISKVYSENNLIGEEMEIVKIQNGAYLGYNNVDFKNKTATGIELVLANNIARTIEVRLGNYDGTKVAEIEVPASDDDYFTFNAALDKPIDGKENIYLVFTGRQNNMKFKSFKFTGNSQKQVCPDFTDARIGILTSSENIANLENLIDDRLSKEITFPFGDDVWIQYTTPVAALLSGYSITSGSVDADAKSWKLQASNNGTDWFDIDEKTGQTFANRNYMNEYALSVSENYIHFRLIITESNENASEICLSEWQLYGSMPADNDITSDDGNLTAQYEGNGANENYIKLTDNSVGTKYLVKNQSDLWIQYQAKSRYKLTYYSISSANDELRRDPKNWTLYGSTNGIEWETIDNRNDQSFSFRNSTLIYFCNTEKAYQYFKLHITENNGSADTQLAELQLFGNYYFDHYYTDFTKSGGELTSSSGNANIGTLTDNNAETVYSINASSLPVWIQYKSTVPVVLLGYSITSNGGDRSFDPKSWKLQISRDGESWTTIDTRTNETFTAGYMQKVYDRNYSAEYSYFRLEIDEAHASEVKIAEWQIYGSYIDNYDVTSGNNSVISAQWQGNSSEGIEKLIDNSKSSKYFVDGRRTFWAVYKSDRPAKLKAYSLTAANDNPNRDPKTWTLYGSNDNTNWTIIDNQKNQIFPYRNSTLYFPALANEKYSYFKLDVEENMGGKAIQLAEWQLFGMFNEYKKDLTENGGILTSSHEGSDGTLLSELIDNNEMTMYSRNISNVQFDEGFWFKYESPSQVAVESYTLTSANSTPNNDPKNWKLQGSNDDANWADIDVRSDIVFSNRCERKVFEVSNPEMFKYYRLYITARGSSSARGFQLAEWELFDAGGSNIISSHNSFVIYPNPAVDFVNIETPEHACIYIYDANGVGILIQNIPQGNTKIDISAYKQGVYIIKIVSENEIRSEKLIVR